MEKCTKGQTSNEMAGKRKAHLAREELQRGRPGLQLHHGHTTGRGGPAAGRASKDLPDGHRKLKNSRKWEAGAHRLFPSLHLSELKCGKSRPTFPIPVWGPRAGRPPTLAHSPVMGGDQLGRVPEVLFETQLEGLANGADDVLSKPFGTLQDVAGWGHSRGHQGARGQRGQEEAQTEALVICPPQPGAAGSCSPTSRTAGPTQCSPPRLTSLIHRVFGNIGDILGCVLGWTESEEAS